jgi:hypothetical protein
MRHDPTAMLTDTHKATETQRHRETASSSVSLCLCGCVGSAGCSRAC